MKIHELKTDPYPFGNIWRGRKNFELRWNDRHFKENDLLHLREHSSERGYTGRKIIAEVHCMIHGPAYGLEQGWVCMSIAVLTTRS